MNGIEAIIYVTLLSLMGFCGIAVCAVGVWFAMSAPSESPDSMDLVPGDPEDDASPSDSGASEGSDE